MSKLATKMGHETYQRPAAVPSPVAWHQRLRYWSWRIRASHPCLDRKTEHSTAQHWWGMPQCTHNGHINVGRQAYSTNPLHSFFTTWWSRQTWLLRLLLLFLFQQASLLNGSSRVDVLVLGLGVLVRGGVWATLIDRKPKQKTRKFQNGMAKWSPFRCQFNKAPFKHAINETDAT